PGRLPRRPFSFPVPSLEPAPMTESSSYPTRGGLRVQRSVEAIDGAAAIDALTASLDERRGALFASSYEYPGRYTRWDMGFADPPLVIVARERAVRVEAANERGRVLLAPIARALAALPALTDLETGPDALRARLRAPAGRFAEEERSKQPSVFSVLRTLVELFGSPEDPHLGLDGASACVLAFLFGPLLLRLARPDRERAVVLLLHADRVFGDHRRALASRRPSDFEADGRSPAGLPRGGPAVQFAPAAPGAVAQP